MKKQQISKLADLADFVGDFIRYWGFRKIHGEIWTVIYLSEESLSGAQIAELLKVSKALVSPALKELESEGLIQQAESENSKTKRYSAVEDVNQVIKGVLNRREKPLIQKIKNRYDVLAENSQSGLALNSERLKKMGDMINRAEIVLLMLANSDEMWS